MASRGKRGYRLVCNGDAVTLVRLIKQQPFDRSVPKLQAEMETANLVLEPRARWSKQARRSMTHDSAQ